MIDNVHVRFGAGQMCTASPFCICVFVNVLNRVATFIWTRPLQLVDLGGSKNKTSKFAFFSSLSLRARRDTVGTVCERLVKTPCRESYSEWQFSSGDSQWQFCGVIAEPLMTTHLHALTIHDHSQLHHAHPLNCFLVHHCLEAAPALQFFTVSPQHASRPLVWKLVSASWRAQTNLLWICVVLFSCPGILEDKVSRFIWPGWNQGHISLRSFLLFEHKLCSLLWFTRSGPQLKRPLRDSVSLFREMFAALRSAWLLCGTETCLDLRAWFQVHDFWILADKEIFVSFLDISETKTKLSFMQMLITYIVRSTQLQI